MADSKAAAGRSRLLHGHGWNGSDNPQHLGIDAVAAERGWLHARPTGTQHADGCTPGTSKATATTTWAYLDALVADLRD